VRGQANLPALAVALLVVTTVGTLSVVLADGAFASAERDAVDRVTAETTADRLVAAESPLAERRNVLNESRLTPAGVEAVVPDGVDVRVRVGGETVYQRGTPDDGRTTRRLVLVAERQAVTLEPPLAFGTITLPRRAPRATIALEEGAGVRTIRANDRVILHDPGGIAGEYDVALSRYETTTLRFDGPPPDGTVTVTYYPRQTTKTLLEVTVDA
jgi:hypothetical protein